MAEDKKYRVVGTRPIRHDGTDKVTGDARYGADINLPGMIYASVLRSPHAHARILSIDTSEAVKMHGVKAVVTGMDLPELADRISTSGETPVNMRDASNNILATGKVLYHGHAVAAVAANDVHTANEAVKRIKVQYEVLKPVMDVRAAMAEDAPLLDQTRTTKGLGEEDGKPSNTAQHFRFERGDIEKGFAEADYIFEQEYTTETVHQGYIEPQNATADVAPDGRVTVWCSTQGSFAVREQVAEICAVPVSKVNVIPMEIGGGFGGKISVYLEPLAVMLSKRSGHPVKMTMNRAEVLMATGPTPASYIRAKMGAKKDGTITAAQAYLAYEAGAFPGSPVPMGAGTMFAPYNAEHVLSQRYLKKYNI